MIGRIQGHLIEQTDSQILVDVGGLAYEVEVTAAALQELVLAAGSPVQLYTHFIVREDAQLLYGFLSRLQRDVFRDLIRISGVGPKLAQSILASLALEELAYCVRNKDVAMLTRVPGVGKKTAERLLMELKDRLQNLSALEPARAAPGIAVAGEAEAALVALGYKPVEAQRAITLARAEADNADAGTEELIRLALKQISRRSEVAS
jgi:Holliday junction DNA helicase RuvA